MLGSLVKRIEKQKMNDWESVYQSGVLSPLQIAKIYPGEKSSNLIYMLNEYCVMKEIAWDGLGNASGDTAIWLKVLSRPVGEQWRQAKYSFMEKLNVSSVTNPMKTTVPAETTESSTKEAEHHSPPEATSTTVDSPQSQSAGSSFPVKGEELASGPLMSPTVPRFPSTSSAYPEQFKASPSDNNSMDVEANFDYKVEAMDLGKSFTSPDGIKTFNCDHCSYNSPYQSRIRAHLRTVHSEDKPYSCPYCDHKTNIQASLTKHINAVHKKIKPFKCPYCPYSASLKQSLDVHVRGVHEKNYKHTCPHCSYASVSQSVIRVHINAVHNKTRPHKCPYCDYTSSYTAYIPKHIDSVHKNIRPFACPHCDYKSSTRIYLQKHIEAVHNNVRPHKCPHCPFTTSYNQYLNKHISAVHLDQKPHQCPHCPFRSAYKSYITKHTQLVHAGCATPNDADFNPNEPVTDIDLESILAVAASEVKQEVEHKMFGVPGNSPQPAFLAPSTLGAETTDPSQPRSNDCVFPGMDISGL